MTPFSYIHQRTSTHCKVYCIPWSSNTESPCILSVGGPAARRVTTTFLQWQNRAEECYWRLPIPAAALGMPPLRGGHQLGYVEVCIFSLLVQQDRGGAGDRLVGSFSQEMTPIVSGTSHKLPTASSSSPEMKNPRGEQHSSNERSWGKRPQFI